MGYSRRGSSRCNLRTAGRVRRGRREGDRRPCRRELGSSRSRAGRLKRPRNKVNSEVGNRVDNRVYNVIHGMIHNLMHNWACNKAYAGSSTIAGNVLHLAFYLTAEAPSAHLLSLYPSSCFVHLLRSLFSTNLQTFHAKNVLNTEGTEQLHVNYLAPFLT